MVSVQYCLENMAFADRYGADRSVAGQRSRIFERHMIKCLFFQRQRNRLFISPQLEGNPRLQRKDKNWKEYSLQVISENQAAENRLSPNIFSRILSSLTLSITIPKAIAVFGCCVLPSCLGFHINPSQWTFS